MKKMMEHRRKRFGFIFCILLTPLLVFVTTNHESLGFLDWISKSGPVVVDYSSDYNAHEASSVMTGEIHRQRITDENTKKGSEATIFQKVLKKIDSRYPVNDNKKGKNESSRHTCIDYNKWNEMVSDNFKPVWSTMKIHKDQNKVECPYFNISKIEYNKLRLKFSLNCKKGINVLVTLTWTNDTGDIFSVPFGDKCVGSFIKHCCTGDYRVPNVVHYVWYRKGELTFSAFTSILGVIRFIKPCLIIFHGDKIPYGKYWDYIVTLSPFILHMKRIPSESPFGIKLVHKEHVGAVMRIEALTIYGGIYVDTDQLIVKSVESYRNYPTFMSYLNNGLMGCFFIMAERNATFLHLWLDGYRNHYNGSYYVYNCMVYPNKIAAEHKDLIHLEYGTNSRPMDLNDVDLYDTKYTDYNWSSIYGIHLFIRIMSEPYDEFTIRSMKTIVGSISRYIIYGSKELCR